MYNYPVSPIFVVSNTHRLPLEIQPEKAFDEIFARPTTYVMKCYHNSQKLVNHVFWAIFKWHS